MFNKLLCLCYINIKLLTVAGRCQLKDKWLLIWSVLLIFIHFGQKIYIYMLCFSVYSVWICWNCVFVKVSIYATDRSDKQEISVAYKCVMIFKKIYSHSNIDWKKSCENRLGKGRKLFSFYTSIFLVFSQILCTKPF